MAALESIIHEIAHDLGIDRVEDGDGVWQTSADDQREIVRGEI